MEDVYEEEAEELDCGGDIDGEEINDLHDMDHIAKDAKAMLKEEDDAVADDPWENGVFIKNAGGIPITCCQILEDWKPNKKKASEPDFKDVDNPGAWPKFCHKASFNPKVEYICYKTPIGSTHVPLNADGHCI
eukprot:2709218-Ditylum_brightwellii.AAC.1